MDILCCALALLGSVVGAGFASGREIVRFFAAHGAMGFVAVAFSLAALAALFLCLAERLSAAGQTGLPGLCASRFGARVGGVCTALFFLLSAVTGGAMLAACAELSALVWPIRPAYAAGFFITLPLAVWLAAHGARGLAAVGGALLRADARSARPPSVSAGGRGLLFPGGAARPGAPRRAGRGALCRAERRHDGGRAADAAGAFRAKTPRLRRAARPALRSAADAGDARLPKAPSERRDAAAPLRLAQPPASGRAAICSSPSACMPAALSTLCAMLCAMANLLPRGLKTGVRLILSALLCAALARVGFGRIVQSGYPILGALCAALLLLLALPARQDASMSAR